DHPALPPLAADLGVPADGQGGELAVDVLDGAVVAGDDARGGDGVDEGLRVAAVAGGERHPVLLEALGDLQIAGVARLGIELLPARLVVAGDLALAAVAVGLLVDAGRAEGAAEHGLDHAALPRLEDERGAGDGDGAEGGVEVAADAGGDTEPLGGRGL